MFICAFCKRWTEDANGADDAVDRLVVLFGGEGACDDCVSRLPKRIQRKRTKGWRLPAGAKCITRPWVFGNPWMVGTREIIIDRFTQWLADKGGPYAPKMVALRARLLARLPELRGHDLACFCAEGTACHGDVLIVAANMRTGRFVENGWAG